ncbi:acid phosphatase AphA [Shimwellia pseudoproteus]|uniref:phosphatidylglycerophosphatase C n=1 Tax=Shimwellia pseudoproteus TaxID=570012 RepID=UPI0018ED7AAE|nr:phosphatidylglycerophosphatase C [Shimwellia pseudoproteus]MBJ3815699.1 acid phosphatase AphA [Shimwellia pseudoproteus]
MAQQTRRVVFFDLDGTLHRQDMLGSFIWWLLRRSPLNSLLVLFLLPIIFIGLLMGGVAARWPISLLLWATTFGHSDAWLNARQEAFIAWFRSQVVTFPAVQARLMAYLDSTDADVWLITGSPEPLVRGVYRDTAWLPRVKVITSQMARCNGGWALPLRCFGHEKVAQLERRIGSPLRLYSGYSDSNHDNPLMAYCEHCWRVSPQGELTQTK